MKAFPPLLFFRYLLRSLFKTESNYEKKCNLRINLNVCYDEFNAFFCTEQFKTEVCFSHSWRCRYYTKKEYDGLLGESIYRQTNGIPSGWIRSDQTRKIKLGRY